MIKSGSMLERGHPAGRVQKLPETHRFSLAHTPDVDEGDVELLPGLLGDPAVAAQNDDLGPGVQELVRLGRELVPPLGVERVEDVPPDLVDPPVEAAVGQPLRLVPFDLGVHVREDAVEIVSCKGRVGALDELEVSHGT
jgi:hypothetical protein